MMTDVQLNVLVGIVGVLLSAVLIVALFRHFDVVKNIAKIQEDLANFYTPDILVRNKKKEEEELNVEKTTTTTESDSEGSTETPEGDGSKSEGDSK